MTNLEHLKVGDKVACYFSGYGLGRWEVYEITGETETRWKTAHTEWRKKDGRKVGAGDWDFSRIEEITPEVAEEIQENRREVKRRNLWRKIGELKIPNHISVERLEEIYRELAPEASEASKVTQAGSESSGE